MRSLTFMVFYTIKRDFFFVRKMSLGMFDRNKGKSPAKQDVVL